MRASIVTILILLSCYFLYKAIVLSFHTQNKTPNQEQEVYETHTNVIEISTTALSRKPSRIEFILLTKNGNEVIIIDWGDGQIEDIIVNEDRPYHVGHIYSTNYCYTIKIKGDVTLLSLSPEHNLSNRLLSICVNHHTTLEELLCNNCKLNELCITYCEQLRHLCCENNDLTSFTLQKCFLLRTLRCQNNKLDASTMNSVYKNLSFSNFGDYVIHCDEIGNYYIASNKKWKVHLY